MKKKVCEECTSTIKQRIIYKLKEQRNEKMYNVVNSEENEEVNHNQTIVDKGGVKDILVNNLREEKTILEEQLNKEREKIDFFQKIYTDDNNRLKQKLNCLQNEFDSQKQQILK